ncbi:MAG: flagellar hook-length control protein FliK, partial [Pseudomonadota bacterium]
VGSADIEVATPSLTTDRPSTTTVTATGAGPTAGAETARHAANQIAVAIGNQPGKVTEIQLSPDELGRVKLSLVAGDGVITLNLMAERAETQDLLRRHLDVLAQEFRNIGYSDINFSFGAEGQAQTGDGDADEPAGSVTVAPDETDATPSNAQLYITTGLDLRL